MGSQITDDLIEEIRNASEITDIVSEYVKLNKKGKYYFGLCPFHNEKTPSFSLTPGLQIYHCYSCKKGGNVINFVMQIEHLGFIDALKHLADRAKIQIPEGNDASSQERINKKKQIIEINTEAAKFFYENLLDENAKMPKEYLENRKVNLNTIRKFGLGYSTSAKDSLYKFLCNKGIDSNLIIESGLAIKDSQGRIYDRFRGRIMFPIFDIRGNIIAFGGRVLGNDQPKYMNSPETIIYTKGKHLYGLNFAKRSGEKKIIVTEGYMDAISLHQYGFQNAVAALGTALTEDQARLLKMYSDEVIIAFDADQAGQAATLRSLSILNEIGCNVKVLQIPKGKDPDEYLMVNGIDHFKKLINDSLSFVEYKIKVLKNNLDTDTTDGRIDFLNQMTNVLIEVENSIEREMYIKKIARDNKISEESLMSEVYRKIKHKSSYGKKIIKNEKIILNFETIKENNSTDTKISYYERILLGLLCLDNNIFREVREQINNLLFTNDENKRIFGIIAERLNNGKSVSPADVLSTADSNFGGEFARILENYGFEDNKKAILDVIKKINMVNLDIRQKQILDILKSENQLNQDEIQKLKIELQNNILKKKT